MARKTARVVVYNPWELRMQADLPPERRWGCPFLLGKIIGIFRHALGVNCWADEAISHSSGLWKLEMSVYPSEKTIPAELDRLRRARQQARERHLQEKVDAQTAALTEAHAQLAAYSRELEQRVDVRTQELRAATRQAQEALRAKSDFLAMMSHEIRTPLNGILGMAQVLGGSGLSIEQRSHVETIGRAGETLLALLNDILDLSRLDAGRLELEQAPLSLAECLEDLEAVAGAAAYKKGLEFASFADDDVPLWVQGDALRLRQTLMNLANNAVKFTTSGEVQIRASRTRRGSCASR